jgi:hypothetical protein
MDSSPHISTPPHRAREQFILRMPRDMRAKLKDIAVANRRSMNLQMLILLELGMNDHIAGESIRQYLNQREAK